MRPEASDPARVTVASVRRWRMVPVELVHALLAVPLFLLGIVLLLGFHLSVPLLAEGERALARLAGARAPSSRPAGQRWGRWLASRVSVGTFWTQDVPLVLVGAVLCVPSFFITTVGLVAAVIFLVVPFTTSPENPAELNLLAWHLMVTNGASIWWLVPVALVTLALTSILLWTAGWLRSLLVTALSGSGDQERVATLTAAVGHLSAGRATLVDAFDAERERIERDLHDGAQQEIVALAMNLGAMRLTAESLSRSSPDTESYATLLAQVDQAQERAEKALHSLRETVHGIRPAVLTERGLVAGLKDLVARASLPSELRVSDRSKSLEALTSPVATTVYFAVSEALTNASKHGGPGVRAQVSLETTDHGLMAVVVDNGPGKADPGRPGATGLAGMAQRVESVGGTLSLDSGAGSGTRVQITVPFTPPWAQEDKPAPPGPQAS